MTPGSPPPAHRTVTDLRLRGAQAGIALLGVAITVYLLLQRAEGRDPVCVIGGGCATVQGSRWAEVAGIPVAALGLAAYAGLLASAFLPRAPGAVLALFTALVGVGFSGWLTYLEIFEIRAVCAWCVTSAILVALSFAVAVLRVRRLDGGGPGGPPPAGDGAPAADAAAGTTTAAGRP